MTVRALARWIEVSSWGFAALGLFLPFLFYTPLLAPWREALARWAYGAAEIPSSDADLAGLMLGITGGSIAGKWIVHALVARGPLAEGEAWARDLTLRGLAAWFFADSIASLAVGASFNVWMINLVPVALVGVPLVLSWTRFRPTPHERRPLRGVARVCFWTSLFGAATGIGIAFGGTTPLFAQWFAELEAAHYGGAPLEESSRRFALAFFGAIGGCTLAQFVMLAMLARREPERLRTAVTGSASILSWFAIDSVYGAGHRGWFNIAIVNLPAIAVTLPPWLLLLFRGGAAGARGRDRRVSR
jgi:hypothetical protein